MKEEHEYITNSDYIAINYTCGNRDIIKGDEITIDNIENKYKEHIVNDCLTSCEIETIDCRKVIPIK